MRQEIKDLQVKITGLTSDLKRMQEAERNRPTMAELVRKYDGTIKELDAMEVANEDDRPRALYNFSECTSHLAEVYALLLKNTEELGDEREKSVESGVNISKMQSELNERAREVQKETARLVLKSMRKKDDAT